MDMERACAAEAAALVWIQNLFINTALASCAFVCTHDSSSITSHLHIDRYLQGSKAVELNPHSITNYKFRYTLFLDM